MYGKIFASLFSGSMVGAGPDVFAVWSYVIAHTVDSTVELNPRLISAIIGMPVDRVVAAIQYLAAPDPESRSKTDEGRRIVRVGEFAYHVPNHVTYRSIRTEEERRKYMRDKKKESRARLSKSVAAPVNSSTAMSSYTEAEADTEAEQREQPDGYTAREAVEVASPKPPDVSRNTDSQPVHRFDNDGHHAAYLAVRSTAKNPNAIDAVIGAELQGMHGPPFDRATIGAALLEMQASGVAFNTALLRGYCRKLIDAANRSPVTSLGEPANRETRNRAILFEGLEPTGAKNGN